MGTVEIVLEVASSTAHAGMAETFRNRFGNPYHRNYFYNNVIAKTGDVQSIDICKSFRVLENVYS